MLLRSLKISCRSADYIGVTAESSALYVTLEQNRKGCAWLHSNTSKEMFDKYLTIFFHFPHGLNEHMLSYYRAENLYTGLSGKGENKKCVTIL